MSNPTDSAESNTAEPDDVARQRVLKLIDFLRDFDALKHPPVRDISSYSAYRLEQSAVPDLDSVRVHPAESVWLIADFVELPKTPDIPEEVAQLLELGDSLSPIEEPQLKLTEGEADNAEVGSARRTAERWIGSVWRPWSITYQRAVQSMDFYRKLYDQYRLLSDDRDTYEMVWGFSRLRWATDGYVISHPLFTIPVEIEINSSRQLSVVPSGALELETLFLANIDKVAARNLLSSRRATLEDDPFDPWDDDIFKTQAREVIRMVSLEGTVQGEGAGTPGAPVTDLTWVLYVRRRRPDYQGFLDRMRELYVDGVQPPLPLGSIVVDAPSILADSSEDELRSSPHEPFLLPLSANEEQQRILQFAQRHNGVVVQGPPGTGKSHTIANLVSHYVAYGKRVLVVSEKEQALRVLGEKIPDDIKPLTVSVLGADAEGRRLLESSIATIQARVSGLDPEAQDRLASDLARELDQIDSQIAETTDRLLATRRSEVERLPGAWPCGADPSPEAAARWVADTGAQFQRIPDEVSPKATCPISAGEMAELVRLVHEIGAERAAGSALVLPDSSMLPSGAELEDKCDRISLAKSTSDKVQDHVADWDKLAAAGESTLSELSDDLRAEQQLVEESQAPWLVALWDKRKDPLQRAEWDAFEEQVGGDRAAIFELRPKLAAHVVVVPSAPTAAETATLEKALAKLKASGKLGMFAGDMKAVLATCQVDGHVPATADEVDLCLSKVEMDSRRRLMEQRWATQVAPLGGPELEPERPEEDLGLHLTAIDQVRHQPERWASLSARMKACGLRPPGSGTPADVETAAEVAATLSAYFTRLGLEAEVAELDAYLASGSTGDRAGASWRVLREALADRDFARWDSGRAVVQDLSSVAPAAVRMVELADRLGLETPVWSQSILSDPAVAGDPSQLAMYWQWRQLDVWVDSIVSSGSPRDLQKKLEELAVLRRRKVTELVGVRAWRRLQSHLKDSQRQALNSYLAAVKRFGKTGGKFKARWLAEIRAALDESKDAVPVWVMPASRALTSFRPEREAPFDVLIVDEASQLGIDALPLLSLASKAIVVGDDKQTSPAAVGMDQSLVHDLIDTILADVPKARVLFNPGNSLYDLALQKFPHPVMLCEHFRSLPEIIEFSNRTVYSGKIEPLRDQRPSPTWAGLGAVKVLDGYRDSGDVNPNEARAVVNLIADLVADPAYQKMTIGVVSLLSSSTHIDLIRRLLFDRLGPAEFEERRIRVGEAANFQGDERDVMVVTLAVGTNPSNPTRRIGAMTDEGSVQRINVAATRARDQMWVVHSLDPERFPQGDLRAELIRHCRDPHSVDALLEDQLALCDSEFERDVLRRIVARGYRRVRAQVHVGANSNRYRIDLVVEGPTSRLAVECDGEAWHGEERWHADRSRQEVLERAGWRFERIRGSAFYRDPDDALMPLWERLEELGIPTGDEWLQEARPVTVLEVRGSDFEVDLPVVETELIEEALVTSDPVRPSVTEPMGAESPLPAGAPDEESQAEPQLELIRDPNEASQAVAEGLTASRGADDSRASSEDALFEVPGELKPPRPTRAGGTKSDRNKALAKALRDLGKPANGETWLRARDLADSGVPVDQAARQA